MLILKYVFYCQIYSTVQNYSYILEKGIALFVPNSYGRRYIVLQYKVEIYSIG